MKRNSLWRAVYLSALLTLASCGSAHATNIFQGLEFKPYFGWEYQYEHIKGNSTWGAFIPANLSSQEFFVGTRYHPNFGLEIGYYHTLKKSVNSVRLSNFNSVVDNTGDTLAIGEMSNEGFCFDWNVYFPLDPNFNIMGIIGLVTYHQNIEIYTAGGTALASALSQVTPKNHTLLRLGVGLEYEKKHWGARMRALWDQTQKLTVNLNSPNSEALGINNDPFKQACIFTVGIFYIF